MVYMTIEQRLLRKIIIVNECWMWQGAKLPQGYGHINIRGKYKYTHRVSYELYVGEIPPGLVIDHLCRVTSCINPKHLEPVTHKVNSLRAIRIKRPRKKYCRNGHLYNNKNTYVHKNRRNCRICNSQARKIYLSKNK